MDAFPIHAVDERQQLRLIELDPMMPDPRPAKLRFLRSHPAWAAGLQSTISAFDECRILFMDLDQFDQVLDTELGERHYGVRRRFPHTQITPSSTSISVATSWSQSTLSPRSAATRWMVVT